VPELVMKMPLAPAMLSRQLMEFADCLLPGVWLLPVPELATKMPLAPVMLTRQLMEFAYCLEAVC